MIVKIINLETAEVHCQFSNFGCQNKIFVPAGDFEKYMREHSWDVVDPGEQEEHFCPEHRRKVSSYRVYPAYWEKCAGAEPFNDFEAENDEQAKFKSYNIFPAGITFGNLLMKKVGENWIRIN